MAVLIYGTLALVLAGAIVGHVLAHRRRERAALAAADHPAAATGGPQGLHPQFDTDRCIGCAACVLACPEGVLAVIGGKAALIHGQRCIGHELCADACPVGAIRIAMAPPAMTADLPALTPDLETSVPNLFVAGELGGLALIKNAVNQGRDCVDRIAERLPALRAGANGTAQALLDLVIVGAGPAGLSASLRAAERGLRYVTLEAEDLGGTVAKYPRQKLVMTSPVEFPMHGPFRKLQISKEDLLAFWSKAARQAGLALRARERVEEVRHDPAGRFTVRTAQADYQALAVILAIGRRGTPRKLGIPGEELPTVMYSLLDAEAYTGKRILVVGGGDSAVEAAMGLAIQRGNRVTLSYRKAAFTRLKDRNEKRLADLVRRGAIKVIFNSLPVEIRPGAAVLEVAGARLELPADHVWIFAGGTPPRAFLEAVGVRLGRQDLTAAVQAEAGPAAA